MASIKKHGTKLIELIERSPNEIARQWCRDVKKNARTPSFHSIPDEELIPIAIEFYSRFRDLFTSDDPFATCERIFGKYAEDRYNQGIPIQETIYALILMKRHIWLYAEFQALFTSALEQHQATESLNRTILMFDYAIYVITEKYQALIDSEMDKKIGFVRSILQKPAQTYQYLTVAGVLIAAGLLTYIYYAVIGTGTLFTHLFYIPIVFASVWFLSGGVIISIILAVLLLLSNVVFFRQVPLVENMIPAVMFILIALVAAKLSKRWMKLAELAGADRESHKARPVL